MSANGDDGPRLREVAYRLFATEFDEADFSYSESDEERAPNYVVTPTGARVNRMFAVGVLTEIESVNQDVLRARIADPTGAFVVYAGQYQPDALAFLESAEPPLFVAVTGKARTFEPEDSDRVYTSIRPETISEVDAETRDRWVVQAAEQTLERIGQLASAKRTGVTGDQLRESLEASGLTEAQAAGITLALDHYGTTGEYLQALRETALDSARVVAGEREEARGVSVRPGDGSDEPLPTLATLDVEVTPTTVGEETATEPIEADTTPTTADEETATEPVEADTTPTTADESQVTAQSDAVESEATTDTEAGEASAAGPDTTSESSAPAQDSSSEADSEASPAQGSTSQSGESAAPEPEASTSEPTTASETESESDTPDATTESAPSSATETGTPTAEETSPADGATEPAVETSSAGSPNAGAETSSTGSPNAGAETSSTPSTETTTESDSGSDESAADDDLGDFEPEFELDEDEREQIQEEYGTEFQSGSDVDEPGEADIDTPDPDDLAQAPDETAADSAGTTSEGASAPSESGATGTDADTQATAPETAAADSSADVDLEDAVMKAMKDLDDGDGADREELVATIVDQHGADPGAVEDAIQDALMGGRCYEPEDGKLTPI